jgi:hypothetical protein
MCTELKIRVNLTHVTLWRSVKIYRSLSMSPPAYEKDTLPAITLFLASNITPFLQNALRNIT